MAIAGLTLTEQKQTSFDQQGLLAQNSYPDNRLDGNVALHPIAITIGDRPEWH